MNGTLLIFTLWMLRLIIPVTLLILLGTVFNRTENFRP